MPREPWRDDPEYIGLWRGIREQPEEPGPRLILADWLEDQGHMVESWRYRLHGLTDNAPDFDPDTGLTRVGEILMGEGVWQRILVSPPSDDLVCVFDRDVQAYRYLKEYRGRCGWDLKMHDWSSRTERAHLLAVPRLEMLACQLVEPDGWTWIMNHLPQLMFLDVEGAFIDPEQLPELKRLTNLRGLALRGKVAFDVTDLDSLMGLRHFASGPYYYDNANHLAELAPGAESLHADLCNFGGKVLWPGLRSLQMLDPPNVPWLEDGDVMALGLHSSLERLNIRCGELTEAAITALAGLPRLRELTLRFARGPLPSLKALAAAPALESLVIDGPVTESHFAEVAQLTGLRVLHLEQLSREVRSLAPLAGLQRLEELRLHGEVKDTKSVSALAGLPLLTKLDVEYLNLSPARGRALKAACPPWVECLVPGQSDD